MPAPENRFLPNGLRKLSSDGRKVVNELCRDVRRATAGEYEIDESETSAKGTADAVGPFAAQG